MPRPVIFEGAPIICQTPFVQIRIWTEPFRAWCRADAAQGRQRVQVCNSRYHVRRVWLVTDALSFAPRRRGAARAPPLPQRGPDGSDVRTRNVDTTASKLASGKGSASNRLRRSAPHFQRAPQADVSSARVGVHPQRVAAHSLDQWQRANSAARMRHSSASPRRRRGFYIARPRFWSGPSHQENPVWRAKL